MARTSLDGRPPRSRAAPKRLANGTLLRALSRKPLFYAPSILQPHTILEAAVSASLGKYARQAVSALLCAVAAAGCPSHNNTSGYGIAWTTVTDEPGDYTSYIVTIDSVTLTSNTGAVDTAA